MGKKFLTPPTYNDRNNGSQVSAQVAFKDCNLVTDLYSASDNRDIASELCAFTRTVSTEALCVTKRLMRASTLHALHQVTQLIFFKQSLALNNG